MTRKIYWYWEDSLANSTTWGSPDMVAETMAYFVSRPYIKILNKEELLNFPTQTTNVITPQPEETADELALQIQSTLEFARSWQKHRYPIRFIAAKPTCRKVPCPIA